VRPYCFPYPKADITSFGDKAANWQGKNVNFAAYTHEQLKLCQEKLVKESFPFVRGSRYSLANEKRYSFPAGRGLYLCWELEGEETSA
jgi:hypothetical protein